MSENKKKNLELFVFVLTAAVHRSGSFKQWDTSAQDFSKTSRSENCYCELVLMYAAQYATLNVSNAVLMICV